MRARVPFQVIPPSLRSPFEYVELDTGLDSRRPIPTGLNVVFLAHFDGSLTPVVGPPLAADGTSFVAGAPGFGQCLNVGGTVPNGGGSAVVYSTVPSPALDLGSAAGDFCMEGWIVCNTRPSRPRTLLHIENAATGEFWSIGNTGGFPGSWTATIPDSSATTHAFISSGAPWDTVLGVPTHLALSRQGNTYRFFIEGALVMAYATAYRPPASVANVFLGNSARSWIDALDGTIDDPRVVIGNPVYTASFTPPAAPFSYP